MLTINNKLLGYVILANSILIGFIIFLFNDAIAKIAENSCVHGLSCPMYNAFNFQTKISIFIALILATIGIFLIFFENKQNKKTEAYNISEEKKEIIKNLDEDEKTIINKIMEENGATFQSKLINKTGFSKVKITRILDKLEARGLIERKRRGMSNLVVIKND